jgi:hypothetical protein
MQTPAASLRRLLGFQLREWFVRCERNGLDPLVAAGISST